MLLTFDSISASLRLQGVYRGRGFLCTLIPVPRNVSSSCGYAAEVETEEPGALLKLLGELDVEWNTMYLPCGKEYQAIYHRKAV
ncbi:MAG: DUF3343 domain-containing protein [Treponema sp.]|nr:DUF3343 domain-containing protein [Treponema sp.]